MLPPNPAWCCRQRSISGFRHAGISARLISPRWISTLEVKPLAVNWDTLSVHEREWMKRWDEEVKGQGRARDAMTSLELQGVSKAFGDRRAVQDVNFEVGQGEFFSLLGPSGCGKTTLLRMIAGFEHPDAGTIWMEGRRLHGSRRRIAGSVWCSRTMPCSRI